MTKWLNQDNSFSRVEGDFNSYDALPVGVYNIALTMTGWKLIKFAEKFVFPYKVYGLQTKFVDYVLKTYENTTASMGILLNGTKGTGKTVTAKELANRLHLPVIIVKGMGNENQNMVEFLSSINCDCVMFFDEFEKNFAEGDSTMLQLMDGVYISQYRRVFLLTTNQKTVNDNLLGRPSRIRYVREFGNLELEVVEEYLEDTLEDKSRKQEVINFIDELEISTIDILKSIVSEINIHGFDAFVESKNFFNVKYSSNWYSCDYGYIEINEFESLASKDERYKDLVEGYLGECKRLQEIADPPKYDENDEESRKAYNAYMYKWRAEHARKFCHDHEYFKAMCKLKNLREGDRTFREDDETIIKIDRERNIIVTTDEYRYYVYQIKNPNSKTSIYHTGYGYGMYPVF